MWYKTSCKLIIVNTFVRVAIIVKILVLYINYYLLIV